MSALRSLSFYGKFQHITISVVVVRRTQLAPEALWLWTIQVSPVRKYCDHRIQLSLLKFNCLVEPIIYFYFILPCHCDSITILLRFWLLAFGLLRNNFFKLKLFIFHLLVFKHLVAKHLVFRHLVFKRLNLECKKLINNISERESKEMKRCWDHTQSQTHTPLLR